MVRIIKTAGETTVPISVVENSAAATRSLLFERDSADVVQAAEDFRASLVDHVNSIQQHSLDNPRWWDDIYGDWFVMWSDTWGVPLDLLYRLVAKPEEKRQGPRGRGVEMPPVVNV